MTYEQRQSLVCQQCGRADTCGYVSRNLVRKCEYSSAVMQGWELGQEDARQQLMQDAISLTVREIIGNEGDIAFFIRPTKKLLGDYKEGDRYKLIIIKED